MVAEIRKVSTKLQLRFATGYPTVSEKLERNIMHVNVKDYDDISTPATKQAIVPLLNSLGNLSQMHILDLASGSGYLAELAIKHAAQVIGIDLDPNVVKAAQEYVPSANFIAGNAEELPFDKESFDAAICSFGFPHFSSPEVVLSEVSRVMKPGGIFSFTLWQRPDQGNHFFNLIFGAFKAYAEMKSAPPSSPSIFALTDPKIHIPLLTQEGFTHIDSQVLNISWPLNGPETVLEFILKGSKKTRKIFDQLPDENQQNICKWVTNKTMKYLKNNKRSIPCPALLITASKESYYQEIANKKIKPTGDCSADLVECLQTRTDLRRGLSTR